MERCAIYARISVDLDGRSTATARQEEDCRKLADLRGWQVTGVYEDPDVSAYRAKRRPAWERMKADIHDGKIDVVLAWKLDRLARRARDFADLDELCEAAGARIVTVTDGIDTSGTAGRVVGTIMSALARAESENISIRGKRKNVELAKAGRPWHGGRRAFGYQVDRRCLNEGEAALIRDAATRVLAGEGLFPVYREWQEFVTTPTGTRWSYGGLQRLLTNPMLSGRRSFNGETFPIDAPAILTVQQSDELARLLARGTNATYARKLLTGLLVCGLCGTRMVSRSQRKGVEAYVCAKRPGFEACGRMARAAVPLEDAVVSAARAAIEAPGLVEAWARVTAPGEDVDAITAAIREDEAALESLARDFYADKLLSRPEFLAVRDTLNGRLTAARKRLSEMATPGSMDLVELAATIGTEWDTWPTEKRRAALVTVIDRVLVNPAIRGRKDFDRSKIEIVWKW